MMVMTAKLNLKKILMILTAAAAVILSVILLLGRTPETPPASAPAVSGNESRVRFLTDLGWDVKETPTESSQVRVPKETSQIYERYNNLQKSQGYDLTPYAGKTVMRHVYEIHNYPGATDPVYATILTCKDQIIGGDITDTGANGKIRGFQRIQKPVRPTAPPAADPTADTGSQTEPAKAELPQ